MSPEYDTQQDIESAEFYFNQRDIVSMNDFSRDEIEHVLGAAKWFKEKRKASLGSGGTSG